MRKHPFFAEGPIITSLLDLDFYKLTMAQFIWLLWRNVPVRWSYINRTKGVSLADFVSEQELREELDHVRTLRYTADELEYLRGIEILGRRIFRDDFLDEGLGRLALPELGVEIRENAEGLRDFRIGATGSWFETTLWETLALCTINELRCKNEARQRGISEQALLKESLRRMDEKIALVAARPRNPAGDLYEFFEFGTRRRASGKNQDLFIERLLDAWKGEHLLGTSNELRVRRYGIPPVGTNAHELPMALCGLARLYGAKHPAQAAHRLVLDAWWDLYDEALAIALTDTYGTDFFLAHFTPEEALRWRGFRLDSGDLVAIGEKVLAWLTDLKAQGYGIEPREKIQVPSDGMTIPSIMAFSDHFAGRAKTAGAMGTSGTFDVGYLMSWSIVWKITESSGLPVAKLSDNPTKSTGDPDEVARLKREVGYPDRPAMPVVY